MTRIKQPTRKRLALRSLGLAAVLLLLANYVFGIGLLLPIQAIRQAEESAGIGRTDLGTGHWKDHAGIYGCQRECCHAGPCLSQCLRLEGRRRAVPGLFRTGPFLCGLEKADLAGYRQCVLCVWTG